MSKKSSGYGKAVPEAKEALKKFRNEVAGSMNITLIDAQEGLHEQCRDHPTDRVGVPRA